MQLVHLKGARASRCSPQRQEHLFAVISDTRFGLTAYHAGADILTRCQRLTFRAKTSSDQIDFEPGRRTCRPCTGRVDPLKGHFSGLGSQVASDWLEIQRTRPMRNSPPISEEHSSYTCGC